MQLVIIIMPNINKHNNLFEEKKYLFLEKKNTDFRRKYRHRERIHAEKLFTDRENNRLLRKTCDHRENY